MAYYGNPHPIATTPPYDPIIDRQEILLLGVYMCILFCLQVVSGNNILFLYNMKTINTYLLLTT